MPGKRFTNEQIVFALRQAENGASVDEVCRRMGVYTGTVSIEAATQTSGITNRIFMNPLLQPPTSAIAVSEAPCDTPEKMPQSD